MVYPGQIHNPKLRRHKSLNGYSRPISKREYALKPRHILHKCQKAADLNTNFDKEEGFQVFLDVKDFAPNEILVKTIDQTVVVEGKHEEKEDEHGHISRHFVRKYTLPKEIEVNEVISTLSTDGQLTIKAPPKQKAVESAERVIQIQQTGEAHQPLKSKEVEKVVMNDDEAAE